MLSQKKRLEREVQAIKEKANTLIIFIAYPFLLELIDVNDVLSVRIEEASAELLKIVPYFEAWGPVGSHAMSKVLLLDAEGKKLYELGYEIIKPQKYPHLLRKLRSVIRRETVELALGKCEAQEVAYVVKMTYSTMWGKSKLTLYRPLPNLGMAESVRNLRATYVPTEESEGDRIARFIYAAVLSCMAILVVSIAGITFLETGLILRHSMAAAVTLAVCAFLQTIVFARMFLRIAR